MRKKILLSLSALFATLISVSMFAAFEAHVVNVTATIENALTVSPSSLDFGTVFPQETLEKTVTVAFSESFTAQSGADDVNYHIKQKPKCANAQGQFAQATDVGGAFACPDTFTPLPLLCPFLSKTETTTDGIATGGQNDGTPVGTFIPSFHGPITVAQWNQAVSTQYAVGGRLAKSEQDPNDSWTIDLHTPCFQGMCSQDWDTYVTQANPSANPNDYILPANQEHQKFGCDLWLEVTGVSRTGTLTVNKVIVPGTDPTPPTAVNFSFKVDSGANTPFEADGSNDVTVSAGPHTVTEPVKDPDYIASFGADCPGGAVNVPPSGTATCTITNTFDGTNGP